MKICDKLIDSRDDKHSKVHVLVKILQKNVVYREATTDGRRNEKTIH